MANGGSIVGARSLVVGEMAYVPGAGTTGVTEPKVRSAILALCATVRFMRLFLSEAILPFGYSNLPQQ